MRDDESPWDDPVAPEPPESEEAPAWPPPEAPWQPADLAAAPAKCRAMAKAATALGWRVRVLYARGTIPVALNRWKPGRVVDAYWFTAWSSDGSTRVQASWETAANGSMKAKDGQVAYAGLGPYRTNVTTAAEAIR